jgi:glutamate 5-kinase
MWTKIRAAKLAARSGTASIIASGKIEDVLLKIQQGDNLGTLLIPPERKTLDARKQWLASHLIMQGELYLDDGAIMALNTGGKSLLAVGVTKVKGKFVRGDVVACLNSNGEEIARGLINYNFDETTKILGQSSNKIEEILGYIDKSELIHCDNLVFINE